MSFETKNAVGASGDVIATSNGTWRLLMRTVLLPGFQTKVDSGRRPRLRMVSR